MMGQAPTLSEILDRFKISLSELSRISGIPLRTLQWWKAGKRKPPEYTLALVNFMLTEKELRGEIQHE